VPMVVGTYVIPTAAPLAALGNWQEWSDLSFVGLAEILGGVWLKHGMTIGALLSNAILLEVTMLTASRLPFTMAQDRFLPQVLTKAHGRFGTPWLSLVLGSAATSLLAVLPFLELIDIYVWLQMTSYILIFITLIGLRSSYNLSVRPFKVPGGAIGLLLCVIPPCMLALFVMSYKLFPPGEEMSIQQLCLGVGSILSGPVAYLVYLACRRLGGRTPAGQPGSGAGTPQASASA